MLVSLAAVGRANGFSFGFIQPMTTLLHTYPIITFIKQTSESE